jgi:competence protein ComEC
MGHGTTLFLLGVLACQQLASLPAVAWTWLLPVLVVGGCRWRLLRPAAWLVCGFLWTLLHAHLILGAALAPMLEGEDLVVEGVISGIPERLERGRRFEFQVERLEYAGEAQPLPGRIRLNWYGAASDLAAGERWRLKVRLRRPHGFANPGGFDYEAWLYRKRLRATGHVRNDALNRRLDGAPAGPHLQGLRQRLGRGIADALDRRELHGIITALAIGDRQAIDRDQWEMFRRTGTSHLVAISGLHIGLVAGMVFFAMRWSWSRIGSLAVRCPAPHAAGIAATAAALAYAALAGFSIPTQRALIMVTVVMAALLMRRRRSLFHTLMTALLFVLLFDPLAVMDGGFWLSFCAVATILFGMSRRVGVGGWWWRWGRLHALVTIGLAPVLVVLFQQLPLASPLANFVAVPWVSFGVVPLVLAGTLLLPVAPASGALLLTLAESSLSLLWPLITLISGIEALQWTQHAPRAWTVAAATVAAALLLAPRGLPGRWLALPWLLPALLLAPPAPAEGEFSLTLLDVGQGLAAVVRTREHVLVYDTGARFTPGFDAGSAVVLPYLRHQGIHTIDTLVISHDDIDHAGGAASLAGAIGVGRVIAGMPDAVSEWRAEACVDADAWTWNGVHFEVLHPARDAGLRGNDASCVVRVSNGGAAALLTGDIEARAEAMVLRARAADLRADILVAPHHGSRTSSRDAFIAAVDPADVLFPAGYRNRFNHPHPEVVGRYRARGARLYFSAEHGAIMYTIPAAGHYGAPVTWRQRRARYWHADGVP